MSRIRNYSSSCCSIIPNNSSISSVRSSSSSNGLGRCPIWTNRLVWSRNRSIVSKAKSIIINYTCTKSNCSCCRKHSSLHTSICSHRTCSSMSKNRSFHVSKSSHIGSSFRNPKNITTTRSINQNYSWLCSYWKCSVKLKYKYWIGIILTV